MVDVLSVFPFDAIVESITSSSNDALSALRLTRSFRLLRLFKLVCWVSFMSSSEFHHAS